MQLLACESGDDLDGEIVHARTGVRPVNVSTYRVRLAQRTSTVSDSIARAVIRWLQMHMRIVGVVLFSLLAISSGAHAQVGERGRITTRSDVKMSIEGVAGTSGKKLDAFAKTLGTPLGAAKRCYGELVKEHPEVVGTLLVELELPAKGKLQVRAPGAAAGLKPMKACIDQAFGELDVSQVPRPAGVRVALELTNTAAAAAGEVQKQEAAERQVKTEAKSEGGFVSRGASTGGEVSFEVRAEKSGAIELVHNSVRAALPGLFDCRRRASKGGSPEGDLLLKLDPKKIESGPSTVANERAASCVLGVIRRAVGRSQSPVELKIHFAP
jgi:hypothetical protein